jgi:hypothetical protein
MIAEFVTPRDGNGPDVQLLPPGEIAAPTETIEAPGSTLGSFCLENYPEWIPPTLDEITVFDHTDLSQNDTYGQYMRMHKVLVGNRGGRQLERMYEQLRSESMPHYLVAAGWAAAESALVRSDIGVDARLALLTKATASWERALLSQEWIELDAPEDKIEDGYGLRIALDLATAPMLAGIISGDVTQTACQKYYRDCLQIAQLNSVALELAAKAGNSKAIAAHVGIGYECNAILAFNRRLSPTWFAMPSTARSDSGYYHRRQTHDLLVMHQNHGRILSATPVEIKAKPSARDKVRYDALLVRGKMHLSVEGKYPPRHTLDALTHVYDGSATAEDYRIADAATDRFAAMVRDYYAGSVLGRIASRHTMTVFHDNSLVSARHPGLALAS